MVRITVPFPAGGGTDTVSRIAAQKLNERWGQPVIVETKSGGNGNIGARAVAQAKPDGYSILVSTSALAINPLVEGEAAGYKPSDFTPVILLTTAAYVFVVNPKVAPEIKTLQDLVAYAKAQRGEAPWASTSEGNAEHLAGMLFQNMAGIKMRHIPYKGGGDTVKDVVGGHVPVGVIALPTVLPYLNSGQLKALAVTDSRRIPQLPDVPTVAESGLPGYELITWYAVWVPAGTPEPVVDKIHDGFFTAMTQDEMKQKIIGLGFKPAAGTRAEFGEFFRQQRDIYAKALQLIGPAKK